MRFHYAAKLLAPSLRVQVVPHAHNVGQFASEHDFQRRPLTKRSAWLLDPIVDAFWIAKDDAERLMDTHKIGQSRLLVPPKRPQLPSLPPAKGAWRRIKQDGRLGIRHAPPIKQIDACPEHGARLGVCDWRGLKRGYSSLHRNKLWHLLPLSHLALNTPLVAIWQ